MYKAFLPLIEKNARILILGTFPSVVSREKGEYYGNAQNKFWRIMFEIFDKEFSMDYYEKRKLIFENGIALWDVIESCEIEGSLDSAIKNQKYNEKLPEFIKEKGIEKVLFNGGKAYDFYKRGIGKIEKLILPSTSPANARMNYIEKLNVWKETIIGGD